MSDTKLWPDHGTKRLDVGGAGGGGGGFMGGRGMEYLLMGSLAVIIVGSLVLTIYYGMGSGSASRTNVKPMYKCMIEDCGHEFELTQQDAQRPKDMMMMGPGMMSFKADCPKCQNKECCVRMAKCPSCEKYYVSPRLDFDDRMMRGEIEQGEEPPPDICPHCQTDRIQWYRDNRKKKKK